MNIIITVGQVNFTGRAILTNQRNQKMSGRDDSKNIDELLKVALKLQEQNSKELEPPQLDSRTKACLDSAVKTTWEDSDERKIHLLASLFLRYRSNNLYSEKALFETVNVFEGLSFLTAGRDMAKEFNKLGGLKQCLNLLESPYSSLQWRAADLIASCSRNNPPCQKTLMECNSIVSLLHIIKTTDVDIVKLKCVFALSAIVSNNEEGENLFLKSGGIQVLLQVVNEDIIKLQMESVLLIKKILESGYEKNIDLKIICKELYKSLHKEHNESHQIIINIILSTIAENESSINDIFADKSSSIEFLKERKTFLINFDGEKYLDEASIYGEVLRMLTK